jgi:hypothetical protein
MKRKWWLPLSVGLITLVGCGEGFGVSYYASTPPPPVRVETFGPAPGADYVWINGYWGWNSGAYAWVPGRWEHRPHPRSVWIAPRWEKRGDRYRFHEGHWK